VAAVVGRPPTPFATWVDRNLARFAA
jgi:hypothetical protein